MLNTCEYLADLLRSLRVRLIETLSDAFEFGLDSYLFPATALVGLCPLLLLVCLPRRVGAPPRRGCFTTLLRYYVAGSL